MRKLLLTLIALALFCPASLSAKPKHKHAKPAKAHAAKVLPSVQWDASPPVSGEARLFTAFPSTFSTVNPSIPTTGSSLSSAPIRANFAAAYADINNLYTQLSTPLNFLTAGTSVSISATGTISLTPIASPQLIANASGISAAPIATTVDALLDARFSPVAGASPVRGVSVWTSTVLGTVYSPSAASTGSANAQVFALGNPSTWTLSPQNMVCGTPGFTNTGALTLNVNATGVTSVVRRSTAGLTALVGGEVMSGQSACFQFDGTYYELTTTIPGATEVQAGNYTANQSDGWGDTYIFTAAGPTLTLPQTTTVPNTWHLGAYASGGPLTVTPNAADSINGGTIGATVTIPQGSFSTITTDGAGHVYASGTPIANGQLATMAATTVKANITAGSAVPTDVTLATFENTIGSIQPPQGRLTLTTGVPVLTSTVSGALTVYYTPYKGSMLPIWNGTNFAMQTFTEMSQATTDATKSPAAVAATSCYDIFGWNDAGTLRATRGPAWTNVTTRGYTLTRVQGFLTNTSAITNGPAAGYGTFLGTICSNAASTIDWIYGAAASGGTAAQFKVWNMYNRVMTSTTVVDNGAVYTYSTGTWREMRASTAMQVNFVQGLAEDALSATVTAGVSTSGASASRGGVSIGLNATNAVAISGNNAVVQASSAVVINSTLTLNIDINSAVVGSNYVAALEQGDGTTLCTFNTWTATTPALYDSLGFLFPM